MDERDIDELLSRGLDADLDRAEMRRLYRLAARNETVPARMGTLASLESGLVELAEIAEAPAPRRDFAAEFLAAAETRAEEPEKATGGENPFARLWSWINSPRGVSLQPLSLAAGAAAALVLFGASTPVLTRFVAPETPRLAVHEVQFASAEARMNWTYRFIVEPGAAASLEVRARGERPVTLQFDAAEPVDLVVEHRTPRDDSGWARSVQVHGIGYATLKDPKPGDTVSVRNLGAVPVLVYADTVGRGGSSVSRHPANL